MSTANELMNLAAMVAPTEETYTDERILIPEIDNALLSVVKAELRPIELRNGKEGQYYTSSLSVQFLVDEDSVREETMEDRPMIFHNVRIQLKTNAEGQPAFDFEGNLEFKKFFKVMGAPLLSGVRGKMKWREGTMADWVQDLEGRPVRGKIVHKPSLHQVDGEWVAKTDENDEVIYKAVISAFSPA